MGDLHFDGIYMIDGIEVTQMEHTKKGLEISLVHGRALVKSAWDNKKGKLIQNLITNPYKNEVNKSGNEL